MFNPALAGFFFVCYNHNMNKFDRFFMGVATTAAKLSYAQRLQVGAVAVKDGNILAFSYNGTLPGTDNRCEDLIDGVLVTKETTLHAEENLIIKLAKSATTSVDATIYITHQPCVKCARMIAAAGFSRLVYQHPYRDTTGTTLLKNYGVNIEEYN